MKGGLRRPVQIPSLHAAGAVRAARLAWVACEWIQTGVQG